MPRELDAYWFHERDWESYEELYDAFEWEVPEEFNIAEYACERWTGEDRTALFHDTEDGSETFTFDDISRHSDAFASYLADVGIEKGDRVALNGEQRPETLIAYMAIWKLGAIAVPLSTLFGADGFRYRLADATPSALIVEGMCTDPVREVLGDVPSIEQVVTIDSDGDDLGGLDFWDAVDRGDDEFDIVSTTADDVAFILYTSGTTGKPKGVVHPHRLLLGELPTHLTFFCNLHVDDADVHWTPGEWSWAGGIVNNVLPPLFYGNPVVSKPGRFEPLDVFRLVEDYGVTVSFLPPTAMRKMMNQSEGLEAEYDLDSMRVIHTGSEEVDDALVEWAEAVFGAVIHEGFAQTEANGVLGDCTAIGVPHKIGKMGREVPGHEVAVVDPDTLEPVATGEVGEIVVKYEGDPLVFEEYWNNEEATAATKRDGLLLTGDLARKHEDGYYSFHSRKDDVIISSGYRIGPSEIEDVLTDHDFVADAGVIGIPDDERGHVPKAFVTLNDVGDVEDAKETLKQHVKDRLAKYESPREVEVIDELPTSTTGKVRRVDLRKREGLEG